MARPPREIPNWRRRVAYAYHATKGDAQRGLQAALIALGIKGVSR